MEKRRRIDAISGETVFPEEMIQHVQSFLSAKEAARTSMLSKSWHTAWLTRPDLDFSELDITPLSAFESFAKETMQKYDELNRKIQSFRLSMDSGNISLAQELILKAMKLGATVLVIKFLPRSGDLFLPHEVLESETLVRLSLFGCRIDPQDQKVCCLRLRYLTLNRVYIEGNTFWDIISMSPSIEELILSQCELGGDKTLASKPELGVYGFHKLKALYLKDMEIGDWFFRDLSSRFCCLRYLGLRDCIRYKKLKICSGSLECINFSQTSVLRAEFNVPRIRKFIFSGPSVPILSFKTVPREWESDITIMLKLPQLKTSWFDDLREFLLRLNPSKISLYLSMNISFDMQRMICLGCEPPIAVEELTLLIHVPYSLHHAVSNGLFRCCRPSFVNLYFLTSCCTKRKVNNGFTELLYNMLTEQVSGKRKVSALHDLEEVNVNFFSVEEGLPLPCKTLLEASAYSGSNTVKVCLQLRWVA